MTDRQGEQIARELDQIERELAAIRVTQGAANDLLEDIRKYLSIISRKDYI